MCFALSLGFILLCIYRVIFLTGPPLKMSLDWPPPKMPRLAPPCFGKVLSMAAEKGEIPNTLTFSIPMGGQSGTLMFFWNQLLTGQHLANSGEAQLKKPPCTMSPQSYVVVQDANDNRLFAHQKNYPEPTSIRFQKEKNLKITRDTDGKMSSCYGKGAVGRRSEHRLSRFFST